MITKLAPPIVEAEKLSDGVLITFEDGKCALYSAALLLETFPQAQEIALDPED
jgi:hypothetical protein